jgi:hypothetical protein
MGPWPNRILLRLVERIARGPYADALQGDLLEEYTKRRDATWLLWQLAAIGWFTLRRRVAATFLWSIAETSTVLALIVLADSCRRGFSPFAWRLLLLAAAIDFAVIVVAAKRSGRTRQT